MGNLPNINWLAGILQSTGIRSLWPWPLMLLHRHEHFIWLEFLPNSISHHFQKNKDDMMIVQFLYPASEDIITFTIPRRFLVAQTPISLWFRNPVNTKWYGDGERFLAKCFQDFTRCCKISSSNNNNSQNSVLHLTPHTHTQTHIRDKILGHQLSRKLTALKRDIGDTHQSSMIHWREDWFGLWYIQSTISTLHSDFWANIINMLHHVLVPGATSPCAFTATAWSILRVIGILTDESAAKDIAQMNLRSKRTYLQHSRWTWMDILVNQQPCDAPNLGVCEKKEWSLGCYDFTLVDGLKCTIYHDMFSLLWNAEASFWYQQSSPSPAHSVCSISFSKAPACWVRTHSHRQNIEVKIFVLCPSHHSIHYNIYQHIAVLYVYILSRFI